MVASLSPEERTRAQRFLKEADRRGFVLGRGIIRCHCAKHPRTDPATIKPYQKSTGKPYLAHRGEVHCLGQMAR